MSHFSQDHAVEALRGRCRLSSGTVRAMIARRLRWLEQSIASAVEVGRPHAFYQSELAALVQAMEAFESLHVVPAEDTQTRKDGRG